MSSVISDWLTVSVQEDLFGTGLQRVENEVQQRPEEDDFLLEIVERFDGDVTAIGPLRDAPTIWIETIRPPAGRGPRRVAPGRSPGRSGQPRTVQLEETIALGFFSSYEKAKRKGSVRPWQVQWEDGAPMGIGLFTTKEFADAYRSRR